MPRFLRNPQGDNKSSEQNGQGRFGRSRFGTRRRLTPDTPEHQNRKRNRIGTNGQGRSQVDFSKLKPTTLRRYVKTFGVRGVHLYSNKEDLCQAIQEHFSSMVVREVDVISLLKKKINGSNLRTSLTGV